MIIIWGRKADNKKIGRVADVCRQCNELRPFTVAEVRSVFHLYYIPLGSPRTEKIAKVCECCHTVSDADLTIYRSFPSDPGLTFEELVQQSHPDLIEKTKQRLIREEQIQANTLQSDDRQDAIIDRLQRAELLLKERSASRHYDLRSTLGCGGALVAPLLVILCGVALESFVKLPVSASQTMVTMALLSCFGFAIFGVYSLSTDLKRYIRRDVYPALAEDLGPLKPTLQELKEALERQPKKSVLRRYLTPDQIYSAISGWHV